MYKKFILSVLIFCLFAGISIQCMNVNKKFKSGQISTVPLHAIDFGEGDRDGFNRKKPDKYAIKLGKYFDQKENNLNMWMIWKTSKFYTISYESFDKFHKLGLEENRAEFKKDDGSEMVKINDERYLFLLKKDISHRGNFLEYGYLCINMWHDIALGIGFKDCKNHHLYHYYVSKEHKTVFAQSIMAIPELDLLDKDDCYSTKLFTNKDGTMVARVLNNGTIVVIVPKRIPSKNLLTFNNLHDIAFTYS